MPTIEIYPEFPKPSWMKVGEWCYCWGEGDDVFRVAMVCDKGAVLDGHGMESYSKLHRGSPMLFNLVKKYRGKEEVVMTGEFKPVNDKKFQLLQSQRKGVKGQRVQYTVVEAAVDDEKEPFVPHDMYLGGANRVHPRVPKKRKK